MSIAKFLIKVFKTSFYYEINQFEGVENSVKAGMKLVMKITED